MSIAILWFPHDSTSDLYFVQNMSRHRLGSNFNAGRRGRPQIPGDKEKNSRPLENSRPKNVMPPVGGGEDAALKVRDTTSANPAAKRSRKSKSKYVHAQTGRGKMGNTPKNDSTESLNDRIMALDEETQFRIAELHEDLLEFKKAEKRYEESGHKSLQHEASKQYEQTQAEIEMILYPRKSKSMKTPCVSMICLPCLLFFQFCCFVSTGLVGEYSKKQKINSAVASELAQVGTDFKKKYIINSALSAKLGKKHMSRQYTDVKSEKQSSASKHTPKLTSSGGVVDEYGYPLQWEGSVY